MTEEKLNVGIITSNPLLKTGFSHNIRNILPILYNTNKYNLFLLCQQTRDGDPHLKRMPWKSMGAIKNFDEARFKQDHGYQRFVAYGNTSVEEFVTSNRLDVCFHIEDIWSSSEEAYLKTEWFKHIKHNFVNWSTADSEPILPQFKTWAENCPNIWFWSSFAERCLKEENAEKYGHCKTLYGSINAKEFYPIDRDERQQLRKKFGIADDEILILYLGRNQLRKLFWSHMEALKIFKEKFPDKKVRLLFHCNWSEGQGGWPLERIRDELGLEKSDVLTTYFCQSCGDWNIQQFEGEDLKCNVCGQNKRHTAGVVSTINEHDLNKIYNLADGSCSVFTSGGFEYTHAESLLAGIPLASVNYSCGEDFCKQDFVFEVKPTKNLTRECGTGFKKFVPDIDSIVDFYEYISDLSPEERKKLSKRGRKWALDNFEASVIASKVESFIDSCQKIDWEVFFNKKKELKDPNAVVEEEPDDYKFVDQCYKKILNMHDMTEEKDEVKHWMNFIRQPGNRQEWRVKMVNTFRQVAAQKNAEAQRVPFEDILDKADKERTLIVLKESMGDHLILTSLLPEIQKKYPESSIYIGCDPQYGEVYELNQYVKKVLPWFPDMDNELKMTGVSDHKGFFNHYINVAISTQKMLNYLTNEY